MSEKPIIMSQAMVIALLEDRKHATRRVMNPQPVVPSHCNLAWYPEPGRAIVIGEDWPDDDRDVHKPKFLPGDVAWVREAWRARPEHDHLKPSQIVNSSGDRSIRYEANNLLGYGEWGRYRHARFMCRWMSRLDLPVLDVRPERVQDMTDEEARLEGFEDLTQFVGYWNVLHGPEAFDKNDWVWRYEFKVVLR